MNRRISRIKVFFETFDVFIKEIDKFVEEKHIDIPYYNALKKWSENLKQELNLDGEHEAFIKVYSGDNLVGNYYNSEPLLHDLPPFKSQFKAEDFRRHFYASIFSNANIATKVALNYLNSFADDKEKGLKCVVVEVL